MADDGAKGKTRNDAIGEKAKLRRGVVDARNANSPAKTSTPDEISQFLNKASVLSSAAAVGRLIIALDATMSRQRAWDRACAIQAEMFEATAAVGGLRMQLVYFRGHGECGASKWQSDGRQLARLMSRIDCRGGHTQIRKVLRQALNESEKRKIQALVYIGDCVEENVDDLCAQAGELALLGVPVFIFQDGFDARAEEAFREIVRLTKGAYFRFDDSSARALSDLLKAVAVYAAGGASALERLERSDASGGARLLLSQLR